MERTFGLLLYLLVYSFNVLVPCSAQTDGNTGRTFAGLPVYTNGPYDALFCNSEQGPQLMKVLQTLGSALEQ